MGEQVSHHPPVTAFVCESKNYKIYSNNTNNIKFNGRFVYFQSDELIYVELYLPNGQRELYSSTLPMTSCHNLLFGKVYNDQFGETKCIQYSTGNYGIMKYTHRGWS